MNDTFTFNFTLEQTNLILRHLDQGKHSEVRQLMDIIISEANAQTQARAQAQQAAANEAAGEAE